MPGTDPFSTAVDQWMDVFMRRSTRNFLRYARESGLSMSQIGALFHIHRAGKTGVTDLGGHLGVTSAAASQMLERLVKQDLIQRTEDPHDRRVKQIVLTDKGCQVFHESIHARKSWLEDLGETLSQEEKDQVTAALNILTEKARQFSTPGDMDC